MSSQHTIAAAALALTVGFVGLDGSASARAAEASVATRDGAAPVLRAITTGMPRLAARHLQLAALHSVAPVRSLGRVGPLPAAEPVVIDLLVAYTDKAARHYADIKRDLIEPAIAGGNEAFRLSGLGHISLRLVYTYRTDYVEQGTHFDHVWRFADNGDGAMDEVHALRDRYHADAAILIVDDASGCGQTTRVSPNANEAFAVVHHQCAADNFTLPHEIGHMMGATHEQGHVEGQTWRDIMSYKDRCGGCPRLPVWSNPRILINGHPAGSPTQDNARIIAQGAVRLAAFR
jgi:peptidyl-Asp metalloendopeptidase